MKKNTLNIILLSVTLIMLVFVSFITIEIYVSNIEAVNAKNISTSKLAISNIKYSPDGKYLFFNNNKMLKVFEIKSGKKLQEIKINGEISLIFSPDAKSVAFIDREKKIKVLNLSGNIEIKVFDINK